MHGTINMNMHPSCLLAVKFVIAVRTEAQLSTTTCCYCHLLFSLQMLTVFDIYSDRITI